MKFKTYFLHTTILLFSFLYSKPMHAQDIDQHEWKHRILIIKAKNAESTRFQAQRDEFKTVAKEMSERKFVVYHITGDNYTFIDYESLTLNNVGKVHGKLAKVLKHTHDFEVILIGLDGGVKLRQTKILTQKQLFDKVDSMPMRRSELRKQNDK